MGNIWSSSKKREERKARVTALVNQIREEANSPNEKIIETAWYPLNAYMFMLAYEKFKATSANPDEVEGGDEVDEGDEDGAGGEDEEGGEGDSAPAKGA